LKNDELTILKHVSNESKQWGKEIGLESSKEVR
jgi:hypothetical protein